MDNIEKVIRELTILSFFVMVAGLFLYMNSVPLQDIHLISKEELVALHRELAINYSLGKVLYYGGRGVFCVSFIILIVETIYTNAVKPVYYKIVKKEVQVLSDDEGLLKDSMVMKLEKIFKIIVLGVLLSVLGSVLALIVS